MRAAVSRLHIFIPNRAFVLPNLVRSKIIFCAGVWQLQTLEPVLSCSYTPVHNTPYNSIQLKPPYLLCAAVPCMYMKTFSREQPRPLFFVEGGGGSCSSNTAVSEREHYELQLLCYPNPVCAACAGYIAVCWCMTLTFLPVPRVLQL